MAHMTGRQIVALHRLGHCLLPGLGTARDPSPVTLDGGKPSAEPTASAQGLTTGQTNPRRL